MTENSHQLVVTIRPELIAEKLQAVRNHEYPELLKQITAQPRLVEMVWFLQYMSTREGGLVKFSADMLEQVPARFGTPTMRGVTRPEYTLQAKRSIAEELPSKHLPVSDPDNLSEGAEALGQMLDRYPDTESLAKQRREFEQFLAAWTAQEIKEICQRAAMEILPRYLQDICDEKGEGFVQPTPDKYWTSPYWFMDDPIEAVFEMMDRRAAEVSKRLAMTVVAKKVFDALEYASQERVMVQIVGDSRFGKSEAVRAWADMRPGLARVVNVPASNSAGALVKNVAEALGIGARYMANAWLLKERVEFILRHSRMFLILDESHYLLPQNYTKTTAPQRLNWVRAEIVDRGLPLALSHTPQTFSADADKFVKKTGFAMQQFFGRIYRTVQLPDELPRTDLIAVARIALPEGSGDHWEILADLAELSEGYLQTVEAVAKLARHIARRDGHRRITVSDLEAAAFEVVPRRAPQEPDAAPAPKAFRRAVPALNTDRRNGALRGVSNGIKAPLIAPSGAVDFPSRSLRSAVSERPEAELVPAEA